MISWPRACSFSHAPQLGLGYSSTSDNLLVVEFKSIVALCNFHQYIVASTFPSTPSSHTNHQQNIYQAKSPAVRIHNDMTPLHGPIQLAKMSVDVVIITVDEGFPAPLNIVSSKYSHCHCRGYIRRCEQSSHRNIDDSSHEQFKSKKIP